MFFRRRPPRGPFVTCHNCDSLLEVLRLSPLELEWAFEGPLDVVYRERHRDGNEWEPEDYEGYEIYEGPELIEEEFDGPTFGRGKGVNKSRNGRDDAFDLESLY